MPGEIFKHHNIIALGEESFIGSKLGITVPNLNDRILFVKGRLMTVDTASEAAASAFVTEVISEDGKSFNLYVWDATGAAATTATRVQWFAVIQ